MARALIRGRPGTWDRHKLEPSSVAKVRGLAQTSESKLLNNHRRQHAPWILLCPSPPVVLLASPG